MQNKSTKEKQLQLTLKESPLNRLQNIKSKFREILQRKFYNKIINDSPLWITTSISLTIAVIEFYIYFTQTFWPQKLPLFRYTKDMHNSLQNHVFILSIPIITVFTILIEFYIVSNVISKRDKIQRITIFLITVITNVALLINYLFITKQI